MGATRGALCLQQQVGGAGIGFGPDDREDVMEELYGNRSGFGKSSEPKSESMCLPPRNWVH